MSSLEFQLSTSGLARAAAADKDFEFIVGSKKFGLSRFAADFLSSVVARLHLADPFCSQFEVEIDDDPDKFELFMSLSRGEQIEINVSNAYFLSRVGQQLGNTEIVTGVFNITATHETTIENVVDWMKEKIRFGIDPVVEVTFIAENFWAFPVERLEGVPYSYLAEILSSPMLTVDGENELLKTINGGI